ncbi:MAG: AI-2E family transporter [Pseudomonadales bacterium]
MLNVLQKWYQQLFTDEETLILVFLLAVGLMLVVSMGDIFAPVIAAAIFAFLLQGLQSYFRRLGAPDWLALTVTYSLFCGLFLASLIYLMPLVWKQLLNLFNEFPAMTEALKRALDNLQQQYPEFLTDAQLDRWADAAGKEMASLGQWAVSFSLANIGNVFSLLIYLVLVPILVLFMLKDWNVILDWLSSFLPEKRPFMQRISYEMTDQIANYARGKAIEIIVVGVASYVVFAILGLNYAALLALLVGFSVLIPYIGAAAVTVPVTMVAFMQWGWSSDFMYLFVAYAVIQALDGNVLVPLLFSEAVNLHPVAIIVAVLFFGGLWGLWGVFFAIPLATLVKALIQSWPRAKMDVKEEQLLIEEV